tara:strand:- start:45 stop:809 length:765 start_codon:yes stop_codon:yes gene_type:complete
VSGILGTVADVLSGDVAGLAQGVVEDAQRDYTSRVRCKECVARDRREDRILISGLVSFLTAFLLMPFFGLLLPFRGLAIYFIGYVLSFGLFLYLLNKFYSALDQHLSPILNKLPKRVKNIVAISGATMAAGLFIMLLFSSEGSETIEHEIVDTWYSSIESIEFESNGEVNHSGEDIVGWRLQDGDLMLQFADDDEYEYYHKFLISEPYLFIAPYSDSMSVISDDCVVLSLDEDAQNESYWDEANIKAPEWCNIE